MLRPLLYSLLYFPSPTLIETPKSTGLEYRNLAFSTDDGERLHGWWTRARSTPLGHVLLFHGNAGNIGERVIHAGLLTAAGFDVLLFDYRGYGQSSGSPSEEGTYRDARAALACLLEQPGVDASRIFYLGESLGGAVASELALAHPPAGLILLSSFTSVRDVSRVHYPFIPSALVPDVYPTLRWVGEQRLPLLVVHGEVDEIVPLAQGKALFDAARGPRRMRVFPGLGHNDLIPRAGEALADEIASWARQLALSPWACGAGG